MNAQDSEIAAKVFIIVVVYVAVMIWIIHRGGNGGEGGLMLNKR